MKIFKTIFFSITILYIFTLCSIQFVSLMSPPNIKDTKILNFYDSDNELFFTMTNNKKKSYIELDEISDYIKDSIVIIEDKDFFKHEGLEYKRILKAALENVISLSFKEGGSTITQQYAKNIFLDNEKTMSRKIKEASIALQLEKRYSKEEILEGYLNTIYFGHGIYGIQDASQFYFNKDASEVTLAEAAILASIPKGPVIYSPINNFENMNSRKLFVLKQLKDNKIISVSEYNKSIEEDVEIFGSINIESIDDHGYFKDYVVSILDEMKLLDTNEVKLDIYTTLDTSLSYKLAYESNYHIDSELQTGSVAIESSTGKILALQGGKNYKDSQYNRVINAYRHPGSTIKPLLYYSALEEGLSPITTFYSTDTTFYNELGEMYKPTNFASVYPNKDIAMPYALATSDNIYAVKTHLFIGEDKLASTINRFNIKYPVKPLPSLALGASEFNLLEMTSIYQTLANEGEYIKPFAIRLVQSTRDNLYKHLHNSKQLLSKDTSFIVNELMSGMFDTSMNDVINVTGHSIAYKLENKYAAKSGSTDNDNWMIGFNKNVTIGVWSGFDNYKEIVRYEDKIVPKNIWYRSIEYYNQNKDNTWYKATDNVYKRKCNPISGSCNDFSNSKYLYFLKNTY